MTALHTWPARAAVVAAALVVVATGFRDLQQPASGGQGPRMDIAEVVMEAVRSSDADEGLKLLLLGGLLTDPRADQYCRTKCNGAAFDGGECQGKLVSLCGGEVDLDFATVFFKRKQKCLGTFTASSDWQIECVGMFDRNGFIGGFLQEGGMSSKMAFSCGVRYSARQSFTESPLAFHFEDSCEGGKKLEAHSGGSPWPSEWSGFWEDQAAFDESFEWPESWRNDSSETKQGPRGNKPNEGDCSQDCQDSFPAPTCNGVPSDLSVPCDGLFNFSYISWESVVTKLCKGSRTPMGAFVHEDSFDVYSTCNGTGTSQDSFKGENGICVNKERVCYGALFREMTAKVLNPGLPGYWSGEKAFCDGVETVTADITGSTAGMHDDWLMEKAVLSSV